MGELKSDLDACADTDNLQAVIPLPTNPDERDRVQDVRARLSRSEVLYTLGEYEQGRDLAIALTASASDIDYPPLAAELELEHARHTLWLGEAQESRTLLFDAARLAALGNDHFLEAQAWISLINVIGGEQGLMSEALLLRGVAEVAIARAGNKDEQVARLANNLGATFYGGGKVEEAAVQFERAAQYWQRSLGADSVKYGSALGNASAAYAELGQYLRALDYAQRSLEIKERIHGENHTDVAYSLQVLAKSLQGLGRYTEARAALARALKLRRDGFGENHSTVAYTLAAVGSVDAMMGNYEDGIAAIRKGREIRLEQGADDHPYTIDLTYHLGDALRLAGRLGEAKSELEAALTQFRNLEGMEVQEGEVLISLGMVALGEGAPTRAVELCREAKSLYTAHLRDSPQTDLDYLRCLGPALSAVGRAPDAVPYLERAVELAGDDTSDPLTAATMRFELAIALAASNPEAHARCVGLANEALSLLSRSESPTDDLTARITTWMTRHSVR